MNNTGLWKEVIATRHGKPISRYVYWSAEFEPFELLEIFRFSAFLQFSKF